MPLTSLHRIRATPLAASLAALFAMAGGEAIAGNHVVANCNDSGTGSLRAVVGDASTVSGDSIDMTTLSCGVISLKTGSITISQDDLTLNGPGQGQLEIVKYDSNTRHRMLRHTGSGTLTVNNLSVLGGYAGPASAAPVSKGGCIVSSGSVSLDHVLVGACKASGSGDVYGGAVYAVGTLTLAHATISANSAVNTAGNRAYGGGIMAGVLNASDSTLQGNTATGGDHARGGAIVVGQHLTLLHSTVAGNHADGDAGAIQIGAGAAPAAPVTSVLRSSTISGNESGSAIGGILAGLPISVQNCTIVFNTAAIGSIAADGGGRYYLGVGLTSGGVHAGSVKLLTSLIANNTYGTHDEDSDFSTQSLTSTPVTVSGTDNLIRYSHGPLPTHTISNACPLLGPLRNNGGATSTHALLSHSPGIDAMAQSGSDPLGETYDQRGSPYLRVVGGAIDTGAYEIQSEIIFNASFDGCPIIPI